MAEEILINASSPETRVAIIDGGQVQEIFFERQHSRGILGNIYNGRICRVLPGMQAAFVEIGHDRAAFLHVNDFYPISESAVPIQIQNVLHEGDLITVQVSKEPLGTKGARLTMQISIAARFLVYMPNLEHPAVSQKIKDEDERQRLREIIGRLAVDSPVAGNFIARTAAEGISEVELEKDIRFLEKLWENMCETKAKTHDIGLVHGELPLALRTIRDLVTADTYRIRIDSREVFAQARDFARVYVPSAESLLELYDLDDRQQALFDIYGVEEELKKALKRKVELKSGGYLVIDQTEAMTTIDVNTGAFVGNRNLEETIFKTNLEATQAICRQLRLRNLGGIIIIDFIDMTDTEHRDQVFKALERSISFDHARIQISEVSSLGLVEMTRKRNRESLEHILCQSCPMCEGRGSILTVETTCYMVLRDILRESKLCEYQSMVVLAAQGVVERLLDEESDHLAELENKLGKPIKLRSEALYAQDQYDIVLV